MSKTELDRHDVAAAHVAAVNLVEALVEEREESGRINRHAVDHVLDALTEEQKRIVLASMADIASAAVAAWRKRDVVGADLYMAMRRMLSDKIGMSEDDHHH